MADRVLKSYRGVRKRQGRKWAVEIHDPTRKKQLWIGSFCTGETAARAYDAVAYYFRGSKARLNFPEAVHTLPSFPANPSIDEIRLVARQSVAAISESGGGGSISGVTELGLVDEEIISVDASVENNPSAPVSTTVPLSPQMGSGAGVTVGLPPSQIQSLSEWAMHSPEHLIMEGTWDFVLCDGAGFDTRDTPPDL